MWTLTIPLVAVLMIKCSNCESVLMTEAFAIGIEPLLFNWTHDSPSDQFTYVASVRDKPDLPDWIHYKYSAKHRVGFLYGVPKPHHRDVHIQVVALNRVTYDTRVTTFPIYVTEKPNVARNEVQVKIDNLNIEDMFDLYRVERLKDVFRNKLWRASADDLYVTFLESAIEMGARLPLRPNEGEGVFIRLGSQADFSENLLELQEEVKPLWKLHTCPRDFKRTTVERLFREAGFAVDWCVFRLMESEGNVKEEQSGERRSGVDNDVRVVTRSERVRRERDYLNEALVMIMLPIFIMTVFATILTLILCVYHDKIEDTSSDRYFNSLFSIFKRKSSFQKYNDRVSTEEIPEQYSSGQDATNTLTSLQLKQATLPRELMVAEPSPNNSISRAYNQPSPPPYPKLYNL